MIIISWITERRDPKYFAWNRKAVQESWGIKCADRDDLVLAGFCNNSGACAILELVLRDCKMKIFQRTAFRQAEERITQHIAWIHLISPPINLFCAKNSLQKKKSFESVGHCCASKFFFTAVTPQKRN